jgi:hypothetical protein
MGGLTSPVKAPFSSQNTFCAPTLSDDPASVCCAKAKNGNGGHTTFSTPATPSMLLRRAWHNSAAVRTVVCIFQLAATIGVRRLMDHAPYLVKRPA